MAVNASNVRIGSPDNTVGPILQAPLGTTVPDLTDITKAAVTIDPAFTGCGYVSEDGVSLGLDMSTGKIREWGLNAVRSYLESFDGNITLTLIETRTESLKAAFGDDYVTSTAATTTDGTKNKVSIGAHIPEPKAWVIPMKDGDARMMIVVPNGQVTQVAEVTFNSTSAVGWNITISTNDDGTGNSIYLLTDDGVVTA